MDALVTMMLVGVMAAIAWPQFRGMAGPYATRAAANQLGAEFTAARMRAIATNSSVRITYNTPSSTYRVERLIAGTWTAERSGQLPSGVTITYPDPATPPTFNSRGLLNTNLSIAMVYSDGHHNRTVGINALGEVTIS